MLTDWETYAIFAAAIAFFALFFLVLRKTLGKLGIWAAAILMKFWLATGAVDPGKENSANDDSVNGLVFVLSLFFLMVSFVLMAAYGGGYLPLKFGALMFVVALFAPLLAKRLRKRKK